ACGDDDVWFERDQLRGESGNRIAFSLGVPDLEPDVPAFDVAHLGHGFAKRREQVGDAGIEDADPPHCFGLLSSSRNERGGERADDGAEDGPSSCHRRTPSARNDGDCVTIWTRVLAVVCTFNTARRGAIE